MHHSISAERVDGTRLPNASNLCLCAAEKRRHIEKQTEQLVGMVQDLRDALHQVARQKLLLEYEASALLLKDKPIRECKEGYQHVVALCQRVDQVMRNL